MLHFREKEIIWTTFICLASWCPSQDMIPLRTGMWDTLRTSRCSTLLLFLHACLAICGASHLERFDMLALTDFQQASHRLQTSSSRLLARNHSTPGDEFGSALAALGDIDGDGNMEVAVGAPNSTVGCGSVHILRIKPDTDAELLASHTLLPNSRAERCASALGLIGYLWFGSMVQERHAIVGIGAPNYNSKGAVFVSIIDKSGRSVSEMKVLQPAGLSQHSLFGASLSYIGDVDGDGNNDLLIGAPGQSTLYLTLLDKGGKPYDFFRMRNVSSNGDGFGRSMASLGDIDNDGQVELLVASDKAIHLLQFAKSGFSYDDTRLKLPRHVTRCLKKGISLSFVGVDDNDDIVFALGCRNDNDGGMEKGAVWIVTLRPGGTVRNCDKMSETQGPFTARLDEREHFGSSLAAVLDTNRDGFAELLIGAPRPTPKNQINTRRPAFGQHRRGGMWIADITGTRVKKVNKLGLLDSGDECIYDKFKCTCSYRSGRRSTCLALASTDNAGAHCHVRACADAFACDCRGRETCNIEYVTKTVFESRDPEVPFSILHEDLSLVQCQENTVTTHLVSIRR